jgi:hypothetical protein
MMLSFATFSMVAVAMLPKVQAHGHLHGVSIDGVMWTGPEVGTPLAGGSAIRMINDVSPITDDTSPDINCGRGAATEDAQLSATAKAGSAISAFWVNGEDGIWPHNVGPLITYLADCKGDCSKFSSLDAEWIKIDQAGLVAGSSSTWVQGATLFKGQPYNFTLPPQIPTGNYIMRHEIIALHNAQSANGAEHYPACINLKVTGGSQSVQSLPTTNAIKLPGGYNPQDPGLLVNVYNPGFTYTFPGPPLAFAATSTNGTSSSGSGSGSGDDSGAASSGDSGSNSGSSGSPASSSASSSASMSASATATASAPGATSSDDGSDDCDDDGSDDDGSDSGDDDSDSGSSDSGSAPVAVVTEYVTVTVGGQAKPSSTSIVTATSTVFLTGGATATATASADSYRIRRRSRVMRDIVV